MTEPIAIASAPPVASDIGPSIEVLAVAIDRPGDVLHVHPTRGTGVTLDVSGRTDGVEVDPRRNTAALAFEALIETHRVRTGWHLVLHKRIPTGVGLGSSSASAAAGAVAAYRVLVSLGRRCSAADVLAAAARAEEVATGFPHAHAVGAALWGGCCIAYSQHPAVIANIRPRLDLRLCVVTPDMEFSRKTYRNALPRQVHLMKHARHSGLIAGLVIGLATGDADLVKRSSKDQIVAPALGPLIPGFFPARLAAERAGALALSVIGSGPSVAALCASVDTAIAVERAVIQAFSAHSISALSYFAGVGPKRRLEQTSSIPTP